MCLLGCCEPTVGVDERFDPKGGWMEHAKLTEADLGKILAIAFDGGLYSGSGSEFRRVVCALWRNRVGSLNWIPKITQLACERT